MSLSKIGQAYPEARETCVAAISSQLEAFRENNEELNGFLVGELMDMKAVECAEVMERAFLAGAVDLSQQGDWEEVQLEMGLIDKRTTPRPRHGWLLGGFLDEDSRKKGPLAPSLRKNKKSTKKKRKSQKTARKKSRKK